jgi:serine/threonine-protein kinase RsbW
MGAPPPPPNVRLDLANSAENVVLVRAALAGLAEAIGLQGSDLIDIQTAATEACNNVVQHAYRGEAGPLEIELRLAPGKLDLLVRDRGCGMTTPAEGANGHEEAGIGLPVIQALAHRAEFRERAGGGTEIWSEFAPAGIRCPPPLEDRDWTPPPTTPTPAPPPADGVALVLAPAELAHAILPRVLCVLAARAHFSAQRLADVQRFAGELAEKSEEGAFELSVSVASRALTLIVGARTMRLGDRRQGDEGMPY